ncbi:hypothetical protein HYV43_05520 [Candidatus Micrarchaeota archaeon]|nr:hypothetical protein [Candidatus Micrarchaeota archaeon]
MPSSIESVALELLDELAEDSKKLQSQIGLQRICILGNHSKSAQAMEQMADRLNAGNYPATLIRRIPDSAQMPLPDFEKEVAVLQKAHVIVIIDADNGGVVGECAFLMQNPDLLERTVLMVPDAIDADSLLSVTNHYVYFPTKITYVPENLVEIGVKAAKQASHRLALRKLTRIGEAMRKS